MYLAGDVQTVGLGVHGIAPYGLSSLSCALTVVLLTTSFPHTPVLRPLLFSSLSSPPVRVTYPSGGCFPATLTHSSDAVRTGPPVSLLPQHLGCYCHVATSHFLWIVRRCGSPVSADRMGLEVGAPGRSHPSVPVRGVTMRMVIFASTVVFTIVVLVPGSLSRRRICY